MSSSRSATSSFPPAPQRAPAWSWRIQNFNNPQAIPASPSSETRWQSNTPSTPAVDQLIASPFIQRGQHPAVQNDGSKQRKRRKLTREEEATKSNISSAISLQLQSDHLLALYPDADTPFEDELDVLNRLLPYHVFQQPKHDLNVMREGSSKGKSKSKLSEQEALREEIRETKFAVHCHRRLKALENRLWQARRSEGKHASPLPQAVCLERLALESDRSATSIMEQELSHLRSELDKIVRVNRAAAQPAARPSGYNTAPSFYGFAAPTYQAPTTFAQYYNQYTYPYGQQTTFVNATPHTVGTPSTSAPSQQSSALIDPNILRSDTQQRLSQLSSVGTSSNVSSNVSQTTGPTPSTSSVPPPLLLGPTSTNPTPLSIPIQIPVSSLPALKALGIMPVPKMSLPPTSDPQPAAVLLGVTENGNMLSLEINPQLLQPPQLSGLAILLSGLVRLTGGSSAALGLVQNNSASASNTATSGKSTIDGSENAA